MVVGADLSKHPVDGFSTGLVDDSNVFEWQVTIIGPPDTLYDGGYFNAIMSFPQNYPNNPPSVRFTSEMWHPNVYPDGWVCISILHPPGEDPNGYELARIIILFLVWIWNGLGSTTMMRQSCSKDWMISIPPLPIRLGSPSPLCPTGTKQPMELEEWPVVAANNDRVRKPEGRGAWLTRNGRQDTAGGSLQPHVWWPVWEGAHCSSSDGFRSFSGQ
ncbi:ubiquitin carrier protein 7, partial [Zea mays]